MTNDCPDCRSETRFCRVHQKHEAAVHGSAKFAGKHDTREFQMALDDARERDMEEQ